MMCKFKKIKYKSWRYITHLFFHPKENYRVQRYSSNTNKGTENYNGINVNKAELVWYGLTKFVYLFCGCSNIIELDLTQFDTNGITEMTGMFKGCSSLVSLKLPSSPFSQAEGMGGFFEGCSSLVSLDLSSFTGNDVKHINGMFKECISLVSLNFQNFKGQNVEGMGEMFNGCKSLVSLDLSSFTASSIIHMDKVFLNCTNLQYINIINAHTWRNTDISNIFDSVPKNFVICLDNIKAYKIFDLLNNDNCAVINCNEDWRTDQKKLSDDGACYQDCKSVNKYEYNNKCYTQCPSGTLPNTDMKCVDCDLEDNCLWCSLLDAANDLCISCTQGYYEIYNNSILNNNNYKVCYNSPPGYYLDEEDSFYKPCYQSCEKCLVRGNPERHDCTKCRPNYFYIIDYFDFINCYQICDYYHYTNITNEKSYCTKAHKCPEEYIKLIVEEKECVTNCTREISNPYYEFRNKCYKNCSLGLIEPRNSSSYYCLPKYIYSLNNKSQLVNDIQEYLLYVFDGTEVEDGIDLEIPGKGIFVEVTTPENQLINEKNSTKSTINLDECVNILRQEYNIYNKTNPFYIFKMDIEEEGMKIPIIEYEVYYPLDGQNLEKLNLTKCENTKIDISIPVKLDRDLFMHNASSEYYNNKCIKAKSESGTDICLK